MSSNSQNSESTPSYGNLSADSTSSQRQQSYNQYSAKPQNSPQYQADSYPTQPPQYSNQYPPQYTVQYVGNNPPPGSIPMQYQGQSGYSQYPPQYQGQYPQNYQDQYQGYQQGAHQYRAPMNTQPRERGIFSAIFDGSLSSVLGTLIVYPFVQARRLLSIRPEMTLPEKLERYRYALPQILESKGIAAIYGEYGAYLAKAPGLALDLVFFNTLKRMFYSSSRVHPADIGWLSHFFLAASATGLRYMLYQPIGDSLQKMNFNQGSAQEHLNTLKNNLQNKYKAGGLNSLYPKIGINLPLFMIFRGLQLGSIDRSFTTIKYRDGHSSLFRKFLLCFSFTIMARFITYPLETARQNLYYDEGSAGKQFKNWIKKAIGILRSFNMEIFRQATSKSFVASSSAMTFALFYHFRDDAPRY